ncbi:MAG: uridine kinase [Gemmatimonadales bacterium]|nr:uridine kinase [Gemmatimonadales bacterium]
MRPLLIGIAGGSGSGKTSVARALTEDPAISATLLDMDAYYRDLAHLPFEERTKVNFDHPDAFDMALLLAHLEALGDGRAIDKPTYDYAAHTRASAVERIVPADVVVAEGILLFVDARVRALFDIRVFVDVADDVRFIRRLQRDIRKRGRSVDTVIGQYLDTVRPMHLDFVEPSKRWAHVILPEGGRNQVGVEMLRARIGAEVGRRRGPGSQGPGAGG